MSPWLNKVDLFIYSFILSLGCLSNTLVPPATTVPLEFTSCYYQSSFFPFTSLSQLLQYFLSSQARVRPKPNIYTCDTFLWTLVLSCMRVCTYQCLCTTSSLYVVNRIKAQKYFTRIRLISSTFNLYNMCYPIQKLNHVQKLSIKSQEVHLQMYKSTQQLSMRHKTFPVNKTFMTLYV